MMEKHWAKSKTIWSATVSLISFMVMGYAGRHNPDTLATAVAGALGSVGSIYGRIKAKHKLVFKERKIV